MENKFDVYICSDTDYEKMVADIVWNNHDLAMVTQEKGVDHMEVQIYSPKHDSSWQLPYDEFINALTRAKNALINKRKHANDSE
jgi:hypothetical protein